MKFILIALMLFMSSITFASDIQDFKCKRWTAQRANIVKAMPENPVSRARQMQDVEWMDRYCNKKIVRNYPRLGMTTQEANESTWGRPDIINTTRVPGMEHNQFVYRVGNKSKYLYFDGNKLTSIQE